MQTILTFLSTLIRKTLYVSGAFTLSFMTLLSSNVYADDTEVFLGSANPTTETRPNILFILDTSGSMGSTSGTGVSGLTRLDAMKDALTQIFSSTNNVNIGLATFNSRGGPIRFPISNIDAEVDTLATGGFHIVKPVSRSSDDAEENIDTLNSPGQVDSDEPQLKFSIGGVPGNTVTKTFTISAGTDDGVEEPASDDWTSTQVDARIVNGYEMGLLFRNIDIPPNAVITSAELVLTIDNDGFVGTMNGFDEYSNADFNITVEATDSAADFSGSSDVIGPRARTVPISWLSAPALDGGQQMTSPNLNTLIQATVSRTGWASGNNIAIFLEGRDGFRDFATYNRSPSDAAQLVITYDELPQNSRKLVGMRFTDIRIPQGAQIRRAEVDFFAAAPSVSSIEYDIYGEAVADSTTFTETNLNLSSRAKTSAEVEWELTSSSADAWAVNERYSTVDISSVVQEIVDNNGWCGGNAMSIFFDPKKDSSRVIQSFDGISGTVDDAPTLRIEFDTDTSNISSPNTGCTIAQVTSRVSSSNDDVEQRSNGFVSRTSGDLELVRDGGINQQVGMRFRNINLPRNSNILEAYIEFVADNSHSGTTNLTFRGHDADNSGSFSGNYAVSSRINSASTSAIVNWNNVPSWVTGRIYRTPDLKDIVQEIVDRGGWNAGNNMSFMVNGSGRREAESYNASPGLAPRLVVTAQMNLAGQPSTSAQTVRQFLTQEVNDLRLVAGTPITNVYREAMRYFRGENLYWGDQRGAQYFSDRYSRVSHELTYTGGSHNLPNGCPSTNLNDSDCRREVINGSPRYTTPITDTCQSNYIVLLSDGFQNTFYNNDGIHSMLRSEPASTGTCNTSADTASGGQNCGLDMAEFANTFDQNPNLPGNQTITTYTIGFTITTDYLRDLASRGGGQFFPANSASELVNAFQSIVADILSKPTTFTAPTLTVSAFNRLFNSNEIYISLFEPERTAKWSGNIKKYFLCTPAQDEAGTCNVGEILDDTNVEAVENGQIKDTARSAWGNIDDGAEVEVGGTGMQIPPHAQRRVYTYTGNTSPVNVNLAQSIHEVSTSNTNITADMLGVTAADKGDLIRWIRGQDVDNENSVNGTTDNRWNMGDPLHSSAITVNYGISGGTPVTKLFVGLNDGSVRMFNTNTGEEEWAFYPQSMLGIQRDLRANPGGDHIYGVDGSPTVRINDVDGDNIIEPSDGDFVHIYIGQRRGGQNYYAFDVTPAGSFGGASDTGRILPRLLWRLEGGAGDFAKLGQSWSKPQYASVVVGGVVTPALFFGGGYDPVNDVTYGPASLGNAIFVVNANDGSLIWSASNNSATLNVPDMEFSIPSDLRIIDTTGDGSVDRIYVGDLGGQVWRVDLGLTAAGSNGNTVVGKLAELSNNGPFGTFAPQDHRRFMYRPQVVIANDADTSSTPEFIALAINSGDRADPLDSTVHNRVYMLRDTQIEPMVDNNSNGIADAGDFPTITEATLYDATNDVTSTGSLNSLQNAFGWYIRLVEGASYIGEKGITEGRILILSGESEQPLYTFNTYIPADLNAGSACSVSLGANRTYFVNLFDATATDIIDDTSPTRAKFAEAFGIASEPSVTQQQGQDSVSVGNPLQGVENADPGDTLRPMYQTD